MKNTKTLLLLFVLSFFIQLPLSYASTSPTPIQEQSLVVKKKKKDLTKKERRKRLRSLRKKYKSELKAMPRAERQAFLEDRIEQEKLVPNPWFSLGLTLLILGGVFLLIFMDIVIIAWVGGALALIGLGLLVVWMIRDMNRDY